MKAADVYFTDLRTAFNQGLLIKLRRLIDAAGFGTIDFADQYAAIKIHFGEPGNLAFLRPNFAATVADTAANPSSPTATRCTSAAARTRSTISNPRTATATPPTPPAATS